MQTYHAATEDDTRLLAERLAGRVQPGDTICLSGDLGAGKTTFTRYFVAALGSPARVSSPTFTLIHEYHGGRFPVIHVDAYRLRTDWQETGLGEYIADTERVLLIEWATNIPDALPDERLEIAITEGETPEARVLILIGVGSRWQEFTL
jgi:tRNA threonylcarbamoyladenosine biosynthesis protein TsaE